MCIILGTVDSVTQTKIFVLPNKNKTRQMTFYSNAVSTPNENMMILPVPSNGGSVDLHTVNYKDLMKDLKLSVKSIYEEQRPNYLTRSFSLSASISRDTLEIVSHGSYLVSIAPTLEDLLRLDMRVFHLTPELFQFFAEHYSREFSYVCCILKKGQEAYEPLCYSHPLHSSGKLFVPTLHYHVHNGKVETHNVDWDHTIYSIGTTEKANRGFTSNYYNSLSWDTFPSDFQKEKVASVRCAEIRGYQKNTDIAFEMW